MTDWRERVRADAEICHVHGRLTDASPPLLLGLHTPKCSVIMGLYAHIEGFLAELAVERGLIPDKETILRPDGTAKKRGGVGELIRVLHENGQIDDRQEKFLTFVLSNATRRTDSATAPCMSSPKNGQRPWFWY